MGILIRILANSFAILVAAKFIPGFVFDGNWINLLFAGAIIGLFNGIVRPIVQIISLPIIFLTLGLFYVIINVAILLLAVSFIPTLHVAGFWPAFWGVIVISLVNNLISSVIKK